MEWELEKQKLETIKKIDMVNWLDSQGYAPSFVRKGYEHWYLSPLRSEDTPSFKVNQRINCWYDFGLAAGGNLVDLGLRMFNCTIQELGAHFNSGELFSLAVNAIGKGQLGKADEAPKLIVKSERPIFAFPLKNYLHGRGIPVSVADQYCCEVGYEMNGREYYGIGFKNDSGGYEIRNRVVKSSSSPKDITSMRSGANSVQVFEGFFDLLSWRALNPYNDPRSTDLVVLNTAAFFEKAVPLLREYQQVHLWLDRDTTGIRYTEYARSLQLPVVDESGCYAKFKDLNDWLVHKGEVPAVRQNCGSAACDRGSCFFFPQPRASLPVFANGKMYRCLTTTGHLAAPLRSRGRSGELYFPLN